MTLGSQFWLSGIVITRDPAASTDGISRYQYFGLSDLSASIWTKIW
jgi:hypothetical protein